MAFAALKDWTPTAKNTVAASYLAWTLDAYDFFLLVFVFKDIAAQFGTSITQVAFAVTLTLACRPIGAFLFGRLADNFGRRPILMLDIACYSVLSFAIAFTPNIYAFYLACGCFGVAMGGVWGICASLSMETIKPQARGFVSGLLQSGYPSGFLISAVIFGYLYPIIGWRGMFMVGVIPAALLILYIYMCVPESRFFTRESAKQKNAGTIAILRAHGKVALFAIILMTGFNFFSHGTQDLYPTFLQVQHGLSPHAVGIIAAVYNVGAIVGGIVCGTLSERIGRRRMIVIAALLSLPILPLWAFSAEPVLLALGAFLMQVAVQGAWGVIPAHLNELSPNEARGTFPGFVYQLGNLLASANATIQADLAVHFGGNYGLALAIVAGSVAVIIAVLTSFGVEAKGVAFGRVPRASTAN